MYAFGLGHKLGVDIPAEKAGFIPTPKYYDKAYGKGRWNYCSFRSVSIGQGEVLLLKFAQRLEEEIGRAHV